MDVPDLVRQAVGDEALKAGVTLGDEDAIVFTPTRALVYRGEGLLSDEDVETYGFDFERLAVSEGRRKTKFTMSYVEGERAVSVPGKRTDAVLGQLIEGTLRVADSIESDESVTGVFRFSEMTLVVTDGRLLKHIGEYTWDADYEAFPYDDLTRLEFEEGSVATQVVLGVGNRSERIKAPNAEAGVVQKTLQEAVFAHHGVSSLEQLNREIAVEPEEDAPPSDVTDGLGLDSGIDPLVSDSEEETEPVDEGPLPGGAPSDSAEATAETASSAGTAPTGESSGRSETSADRASENAIPSDAATDATGGSSGQQRGRTGDDTADAGGSARSNDAVAEELASLTAAVERQNELLTRQQQTVQKLIEELRQGR